ncbi:YifB family Mg chelatase-like AAA ATPase [Corynebacterium uterequi]|uniref:Mg chelatase-related protein n=1 Tax=Corynebacterium uterequi TaxID=1072256 RepID=A0A0G3HHF3_9CORY|nr:YifB family Mg chelatase-like AAA ATPase [Corynebacterium uterequi]AKK11358.1 Mg chelatase-related protein [Corynebacterium uterequi]
MALGKALTAAPHGLAGRIVTVEANIGPGLPGMHIVGLGDTAVRESRFRLRTAVANAQLNWPRTKIVLSLSPADVPKRGSHFDLALCLAVLAAGNPQAQQRLDDALILGELGLDGAVRPVTSVLPLVAEAHRCGITRVIVPAACGGEAALVDGVDVRVVHTLAEAWQWALDATELPTSHRTAEDTPAATGEQPDFSDLAGNDNARWAAEVAAAGGHHMFLVGPPGSGKSMIAERLPSILPPLSPEEAMEVAMVRSISAEVPGRVGYSLTPPLCAPHHTITRAALIGGGSGVVRCGAITQAHRGVLFLDEVSEIPARVLDGLRTPLEHHEVELRRGAATTVFPASFQLVMAANPCRCGAEQTTDCRCSVAERRTYLANLSGPLLDRIDIIAATTAARATVAPVDAEPSAVIAERVALARQRAARRWECLGGGTNAAVPGPYLRRHAPADEAGMALLQALLGRRQLTQRGVDHSLRVAWTLSDLAGNDRPGLDNVACAVQLRSIGTAGLREAA